MKLTLAIATYNEEKNIHFALDSTIGWVDEVVVVDGGSTDKTLEVLRAYGEKVRIIETDNPPMFHINKQKAIEAAQGEWILQLDADEEVTPELRTEVQEILNPKSEITNKPQISNPKEILKQVQDDRERIVAYQIPRKNFFLGRPLMKGGVYPDYTIRLYKKGIMRFPCQDVHENVTPIADKIQNTKSQILNKSQIPSATQNTQNGHSKNVEGNHNWLGTLENPMNHYSDPTFGRYLARWKRYNEAEAHRVLAEAKKLYGDDEAKLGLWKAIFLIKTFLFLPPYWFAKTYVRHKGYADGWQGFVFHLMSAMRWWGIGGKVLDIAL